MPTMPACLPAYLKEPNHRDVLVRPFSPVRPSVCKKRASPTRVPEVARKGEGTASWTTVGAVL
jgi:hypothetical protein